MNEIIVTGSTGVIGRRAVRELLAAGHRVTGVTRSARGRERLDSLGARAVEADVFDDASLRRAFDGADAVVNLLTHVRPPIAWPIRPPLGGERRGCAPRPRRRSRAPAGAAGVQRLVQESISFSFYADGGDAWLDDAGRRGARDDEPPLTAERNGAATLFRRRDRSFAALRLFMGPTAGQRRPRWRPRARRLDRARTARRVSADALSSRRARRPPSRRGATARPGRDVQRRRRRSRRRTPRSMFRAGRRRRARRAAPRRRRDGALRALAARARAAGLARRAAGRRACARARRPGPGFRACRPSWSASRRHVPGCRLRVQRARRRRRGGETVVQELAAPGARRGRRSRPRRLADDIVGRLALEPASRPARAARPTSARGSRAALSEDRGTASRSTSRLQARAADRARAASRRRSRGGFVLRTTCSTCRSATSPTWSAARAEAVRQARLARPTAT